MHFISNSINCFFRASEGLRVCVCRVRSFTFVFEFETVLFFVIHELASVSRYSK